MIEKYGYQYTASLEMSKEELETSLQAVLCKKLNFIAVEQDTTKHKEFWFKHSKASFLRAFFLAIPSQIKWYTEIISPSKTKILFFVTMYPWLKFYLILALLLSGFLGMVSSYEMDRYITSHFFNLSQVPFGVKMAGFYVGMASFISIAIIFLGFIALHYRYGSYLKNMLLIINGQKPKNSVDIFSESKITVIKRDWEIYLFSFAALAIASVTDISELSPQIPSIGSPWFLAVVLAGLCLLWYVTWRLGKCSVPRSRLLVLAFNGVAACIAIMLLWMTVFHFSNLHATADTIRTHIESGNTCGIFPADKPFLPSVNINKSAIITYCVTWHILGTTIFFIIIVLSFTVSPIAEMLIGGKNSRHSKHIASILSREEQSKKEVFTEPFKQVKSTKYFIWIIFFLLSCCYWINLLLICNILIKPLSHNYAIFSFYSHDFAMYDITTIVHYIMGESASPVVTKMITGSMFVIPFTPFLFLIFLHLRSVMKPSHSYKLSKLTPDHWIISKVLQVTSDMGVEGVHCYIDKNSGSYSPKADFRGIVPQKMIIFTCNSFEFIMDNPEHGLAIIAHEVVHLKCHCKIMRDMRILGRTSGVGIGFLSIFLDSYKIEDEADDIARNYVCGLGLDQNLIGEAAVMIEYTERFSESHVSDKNSNVLSYSPSDSGKIEEDCPKKISIFREIVDSFKTMYAFFFTAECYDYFHRHAKHRFIITNNDEV